MTQSVELGIEGAGTPAPTSSATEAITAPESPHAQIQRELGKLPEEIAEALKTLLQKYLGLRIDLTSFDELIKVAPTKALIENEAPLKIAAEVFGRCLEVLCRLDAEEMEGVAKLVTKLRLITHERQREITELLERTELVQAGTALDSYIRESHPYAKNQSYQSLKSRYEVSAGDSLFDDALLSYEVIKIKAVGLEIKSDIDLRLDLKALLTDSTQRNRDDFEYRFFAITRELYYRETDVYLSESEMLGVLMLCDPRAHEIDSGKKSAKLLTGYTDFGNNTQAMLVMVAAYKATTIPGQEIDIFVRNDAQAKDALTENSRFFSYLGITSGIIETGAARKQVLFTTIANIALRDGLAKINNRERPSLSNTLALIDGAGVLLARDVAAPISLDKFIRPEQSLIKSCLKFFSTTTNKNVDDFLSSYTQFNHVPKPVITALIQSVADHKSDPDNELEDGSYDEFDERTESFPALVIGQYYRLINLTASPATPSSEPVYQHIFGDNFLDITLPKDSRRVDYDYSMKLERAEEDKWRNFVSIAKTAWRDGQQELLIVTEDPEAVATILKKLKSPISAADGDKTAITILTPDSAARHSFDSTESARTNTNISVVITDFIDSPEVLQRIKEIAERSGNRAANIIHLVSLEELADMDLQELFDEIYQKEMSSVTSQNLKNSINLVMDARAIVTDYYNLLKAERIKLISECLERHYRQIPVTTSQCSETPGEAQVIFSKLYKRRKESFNARRDFIELQELNEQFTSENATEQTIALYNACSHYFSQMCSQIVERVIALYHASKSESHPEFESTSPDDASERNQPESSDSSPELATIIGLNLKYISKIRHAMSFSADDINAFLNGSANS